MAVGSEVVESDGGNGWVGCLVGLVGVGGTETGGTPELKLEGRAVQQLSCQTR